MKKLLFLFVALFFGGGCATTPINNETAQQQEKNTRKDTPQEQLQENSPEQSQERVNEMLILQKKIQDINSEISRLIEYHHNEIEKLKDEKEPLSKKLNELYNLEKQYQGLK